MPSCEMVALHAHTAQTSPAVMHVLSQLAVCAGQQSTDRITAVMHALRVDQQFVLCLKPHDGEIGTNLNIYISTGADEALHHQGMAIAGCTMQCCGARCGDSIHCTPCLQQHSHTLCVTCKPQPLSCQSKAAHRQPEAIDKSYILGTTLCLLKWHCTLCVVVTR